ncbi:hypothetical protein [Noviherbaspirillum aridicola]|uniref:Uncharacterized protein n=1 Tax=Noviherbaspirillum aridicola TaxID=2849687 RepID=A0ABQ4PZS2_9BURK|nr:hypothetical protein [Noviherbaspirillum aridicola]GIZ50029.1 hypothetical protein NCCP691_00430 [Noviherbaspirillum aridicola]
MSTMTIASPAHVAGSSYLENVGVAARNLLAAIFAVRPQAPVAEKTDEVSIAKLYRMAASYDSVMPNLAQELRTIALRA